MTIARGGAERSRAQIFRQASVGFGLRPSVILKMLVGGNPHFPASGFPEIQTLPPRERLGSSCQSDMSSPNML
jgi:hypothetical protein